MIQLNSSKLSLCSLESAKFFRLLWLLADSHIPISEQRTSTGEIEAAATSHLELDDSEIYSRPISRIEASIHL